MPIVFTLSDKEARFMRVKNPQIKPVNRNPNRYTIEGTCGYGIRKPDGSIECTVYNSRSRPDACKNLQPDSRVCVSLCYRAGLL